MCPKRYTKSLLYFTFGYIFFQTIITKLCQNNLKCKINIVAFRYTRLYSTTLSEVQLCLPSLLAVCTKKTIYVMKMTLNYGWLSKGWYIIIHYYFCYQKREYILHASTWKFPFVPPNMLRIRFILIYCITEECSSIHFQFLHQARSAT
jgi:hypothetical protein